ncbi:MAG: hypothetical protein A2620_00030 [Acidobacteria bacterium RIFCSPHIGHO2_01_FULL_67_28]|nr:MAG: hypothetical protein A2620_00030 [Acidobacteria bacterium RIFCSPHIGHO2_01_FULL_67_28]
MLTTIVFALTLAMIAAHAGEWVLLGRVARAARTGVPVRSSLTGFLGLMNFLRFEAFYYVALFAFWLFTESNVPGVAVFLLGAVHLGGWVALERKHSLPRLEEVAARATAEPGTSGRRLRQLLMGVAAFDAAEVVVLAFIAYRLATAG